MYEPNPIYQSDIVDNKPEDQGRPLAMWEMIMWDYLDWKKREENNDNGNNMKVV